MRKWKTSSGIEIFQILSGRSNSYLIRYEKGNILVDTGKKSAFDELIESLRQLHVQMNEIGYLVLTHTHFDHCQNAAKLKSLANCQIILGQPEADFAISGYTPLPKCFFPGTWLISRIGNWIGKARFGYNPFSPDLLIQDEILLGNQRIVILPTPGHSSGSVSLIIDSEIALVGDTLFGVFHNSVMPPFGDDLPQMIKSWSSLLSFNCHTYLPGHGKQIKHDLLQSQIIKYSGKINQ